MLKLIRPGYDRGIGIILPMKNRLTISLAVWIVYVVIIVFMPRLYRQHELHSQSDFASSTIGIELFVAAAFLFGFVLIAGWRCDVGLKMPRPGTKWRILWLPLLFIALFLSIGIFFGFKPLPSLAYAGLNTVAIAFGEELAFRGVLFTGARSQFAPRGAIIFACLIFGLGHVLNGFGTGDFAAATIQAIAATLTGFLFIAILIRTGSLFPGMIIHFLWDMSIFSGSTPSATHANGSPSLTHAVLPILFVMPNFLYALWLLRDVGSMNSEELLQ